MSDSSRWIIVKAGTFPILYYKQYDKYDVVTEDTEEVIETFSNLAEAEEFVNDCLKDS